MECLPERHRHGIFQLRAPHLQHVGELLSLFLERVDEFLKMLNELLVCCVQAKVNRGRVGVVG